MKLKSCNSRNFRLKLCFGIYDRVRLFFIQPYGLKLTTKILNTRSIDLHTVTFNDETTSLGRTLYLEKSLQEISGSTTDLFHISVNVSTVDR